MNTNNQQSTQNQNNNNQSPVNVNTNEQNQSGEHQGLLDQQQPNNQQFEVNQFGRSTLKKSTFKMKSDTDERNISEWFKKVDEENKPFRLACKDLCCFSMGQHHFTCGTGKMRDKVQDLGVGVNLYFRFLKQLGCCFFIFTILAIPQIYISIESFRQSGQIIELDVNTLLMSTTIGSIGLNNKQCFIGQFQNESDSIDISLACQTGIIDFNNSFVFNLIQSNEQDCLYINSQDLISQSGNMDTINQNNCNDKYCNLTLSRDNFNQNIAQQRVYVGASCKESTIYLLTIWEVKQKYIPIFLSSVDIAITLLMMYFLINLSYSESAYQRQSELKQPMLEHFSIQVSQIPQQDQIEQSFKDANTTKFLEQLKDYLSNGNENVIYDIQTSETQKYRELWRELFDLKKQLGVNLEELIKNLKKVEQKEFFSSGQELCRQLYQQEYESFIITNNQQLLKYKSLIQKQNDYIMKIWDDIERTEQQLETLETQINMKYVWVTCSTMKQKQNLLEKYSSLPIDWCYFYCCFCCFSDEKKNELFMKRFKLQIKDAPNPDNIVWANLETSSKERICLRFTSLIVTLLILACSFVFISWMNQMKKDFIQKYPSINCDLSVYQNITLSQVQLELDGKSSIKGYVECYCKPNFNKLVAQSMDNQTQAICNDWLTAYLFQQILPWFVVFGLIVVNVIIQFILIFLSKCEKHQILSEEYASRIFKIFLTQFLNTGLILLLTNIDFGITAESSIPQFIRFVFEGKYTDIDPQWCYNVGIILLLTLLINAGTQPIVLLCELLVRYLIKCLDQCSCILSKKSTRKKDFKQFRETYIGQDFKVDLRYAQVLTAVFVCFMYGAALPFLYFTTFLTILFLYWVDKLLLFKQYRKPIILDQSLAIVVKKLLWLAILIHLGFSVYIFGSTKLFQIEDSFSDINQVVSDNLKQSQNVTQDWIDRALTIETNLILFVLLALMIVVFILSFLCYKPIKNCLSTFFKCCNDKFNKGDKYNEQISEIENCRQKLFWKLLGMQQIKTDYQFTKYQEQSRKKIYESKRAVLSEELGIPILKSGQINQMKNVPLTISVMQQENQQPLNINAIRLDRKHELVGLSCYHMAYNPNYYQYFPWQEIEQIE